MDFLKSKATTETYELLDSNVVYMDPDDQELIISVYLDEESVIKIYILFREDKKNIDFSTKTEIINGEVHITNFNFNNPLGIGSSKAIKLFQSNGISFYFHFWVYKVGTQGTRRVEYNFFKEK